MDDFGWIITGVSALIGILASACVVALPVLILGGLGLFLYRRSRQSSAARQEAQAWPGTQGAVLASSIQVRRTGRSRSEIPVVLYQYEVKGKTYQSHAVRAGEQYLNVRVAGQARATVARYPAGASVTVYYNPANPAESALER